MKDKQVTHIAVRLNTEPHEHLQHPWIQPWAPVTMDSLGKRFGAPVAPSPRPNTKFDYRDKLTSALPALRWCSGPATPGPKHSARPALMLWTCDTGPKAQCPPCADALDLRHRAQSTVPALRWCSGHATPGPKHSARPALMLWTCDTGPKAQCPPCADALDMRHRAQSTVPALRWCSGHATPGPKHSARPALMLWTCDTGPIAQCPPCADALDLRHRAQSTVPPRHAASVTVAAAFRRLSHKHFERNATAAQRWRRAAMHPSVSVIATDLSPFNTRYASNILQYNY